MALPTARAASWFARSGRHCLISDAAALESELRALPVDLEALEAGEREGNAREPLVVVADEELPFTGPFRPEVVAPLVKYEPCRVGLAGCNQGAAQCLGAVTAVGPHSEICGIDHR